jgi:hypothetical protein
VHPDWGGGWAVARLPVASTNIWMQVEISNAGELCTLYVVEQVWIIMANRPRDLCLATTRSSGPC